MAPAPAVHTLKLRWGEWGCCPRLSHTSRFPSLATPLPHPTPQALRVAHNLRVAAEGLLPHLRGLRPLPPPHHHHTDAISPHDLHHLTSQIVPASALKGPPSSQASSHASHALGALDAAVTAALDDTMAAINNAIGAHAGGGSHGSGNSGGGGDDGGSSNDGGGRSNGCSGSPHRAVLRLPLADPAGGRSMLSSALRAWAGFNPQRRPELPEVLRRHCAALSLAAEAFAAAPSSSRGRELQEPPPPTQQQQQQQQPGEEEQGGRRR